MRLAKIHVVEGRYDGVRIAKVSGALCWWAGLRWGIMGNMMLNHLAAAARAASSTSSSSSSGTYVSPNYAAVVESYKEAQEVAKRSR